MNLKFLKLFATSTLSVSGDMCGELLFFELVLGRYNGGNFHMDGFRRVVDKRKLFFCSTSFKKWILEMILYLLK